MVGWLSRGTHTHAHRHKGPPHAPHAQVSCQRSPQSGNLEPIGLPDSTTRAVASLPSLPTKIKPTNSLNPKFTSITSGSHPIPSYSARYRKTFFLRRTLGDKRLLVHGLTFKVNRYDDLATIAGTQNHPSGVPSRSTFLGASIIVSPVRRRSF